MFAVRLKKPTVRILEGENLCNPLFEADGAVWFQILAHLRRGPLPLSAEEHAHRLIAPTPGSPHLTSIHANFRYEKPSELIIECQAVENCAKFTHYPNA